MRVMRTVCVRNLVWGLYIERERKFQGSRDPYQNTLEKAKGLTIVWKMIETSLIVMISELLVLAYQELD